MKRNCDNCIFAQRSGGCVSWNCEPIPIREAEKAWKRVQEVVRCKDCLIWDAEKYGYGWCKYNARTTHENWYCADGEREREA